MKVEMKKFKVVVELTVESYVDPESYQLEWRHAGMSRVIADQVEQTMGCVVREVGVKEN